MPDPVRPGLSRRTFLLLAGAVTFAGCGRRRDGERRGLFGFGRRDEPDTLEPEGGFLSDRVDPRPLVPSVDSMTIEQVTGGVIVHARAVMPTQEYWDADLVPASGDNPSDGIFRFDFRAWPPIDAAQARIGPPQSRELVVGAFVSSGNLDGVRSVSVVAQAGGLSRSV